MTKKVVKKVGKAQVEVMFVRLTDPIVTRKIPKNTRVDDFLENLDIEFDNIRVNQKLVKPSYILKSGDIISQLQRVSGGLK